MIIVWASVAIAGSGPWVVGDGGFTLYTGAEVQRLRQLGVVVNGERDVIAVGEGLSTIGVKGIASVGFGRRAELQLGVPWYRVQANRIDHPLCVALGLGACETTQGVGVVEARAKGLVLDEFFGAPLSVAVGTELRFGDFTANARERITNLGEGTFDVAPFASVGRTGALGDGFYSAWFEGLFRYRVPMTRSYPQNTGNDVVPGSEVGGSAEVLMGPKTSFGLGPSVSGLFRLSGRDWGELDLTDPDRFGALKVGLVRVGGTAVLRGGRVSTSASVQRTVYASNNPSDTLLVSVGLQFDGRFTGVGDG